MNCSPPGSSVHGTYEARMLEWVAISFSRGSSRPRDRTWVSWISCITGGSFTAWAIGEAHTLTPGTLIIRPCLEWKSWRGKMRRDSLLSDTLELRFTEDRCVFMDERTAPLFLLIMPSHSAQVQVLLGHSCRRESKKRLTWNMPAICQDGCCWPSCWPWLSWFWSIVSKSLPYHLIERWRLPQVLQGFFFPLEGHFFFPKSKLDAGSL